MTHVVVALDNLTLRGDDVDPKTLLAIGVIQNNWMEQNREVLAETYFDLLAFGSCTIPVNLH